MITVELKKLRFYGYHGLYLEEKKIGAEFEVNLSVLFLPPEKITSLDETIDYAKLYHLVKKEMEQPHELLETLVIEITQSIHFAFPAVKRIDITVTKLHVPIIGFAGTAGTSYRREY